MNRLEVKWDDWIDFNAYLNNQRDAQSQKIRAGLKYSLIDVKSSIDIITKVKKLIYYIVITKLLLLKSFTEFYVCFPPLSRTMNSTEKSIWNGDQSQTKLSNLNLIWSEIPPQATMSELN